MPAFLTFLGIVFATAFPVKAQNTGLNVVASIKPVHSLVAGVMAGIGVPELILQGASSPHSFSLKPSQAVQLENANLIFWIGPGMEAFLEKPISTIGASSQSVSMVGAPGIVLLAPREGGAFEAHEHHDSAGHGSEGQQNEGQGEQIGVDPHIWLDPDNAKAKINAIVKALGSADPANRMIYQANGETMLAKLDALAGEVDAIIESVRGRKFFVFHDAYHYFERRFGIEAAGSITVNPEVAPGVERLKEIRDLVSSFGATCIFSEPQFRSNLIDVVSEGTNTHIGVLDPLGSGLESGPDFYFNLVRTLALSLRDCLSDS
jgi:zinc transport system substrate-binding protein